MLEGLGSGNEKDLLIFAGCLQNLGLKWS